MVTGWRGRRAGPGPGSAIGLLAALYQSSCFTAVSLTSVPRATLVTIGTAPVIVLGVDRVTGRQTGRFAAATNGLALTGLACWSACHLDSAKLRSCPARAWPCLRRPGSKRSP